jgi:hypothetical protein
VLLLGKKGDDGDRGDGGDAVLVIFIKNRFDTKNYLFSENNSFMAIYPRHPHHLLKKDSATHSQDTNLERSAF